MSKPKIFVDMDGTLAEWKTIEVPTQIPTDEIQKFIYDKLYQPDYFYTLKPHSNLIAAIQRIINENLADVYILSCVLPLNQNYPNSNPRNDKNKWLDLYFGHKIPYERRLFVPDGEPKIESLKRLFGIQISSEDILIDDYTKNLNDWCSHVDSELNNLRAIKCFNGINWTKGTWNGPIFNKDDSEKNIVNYITGYFMEEEKINESEIEENEL